MPLSTALDTVAAFGASIFSMSCRSRVSGTTVVKRSRYSSSVAATRLLGDLYSVLGAAAHTTRLCEGQADCLPLLVLCRHLGVPSTDESAIMFGMIENSKAIYAAESA